MVPAGAQIPQAFVMIPIYRAPPVEIPDKINRTPIIGAQIHPVASRARAALTLGHKHLDGGISLREEMEPAGESHVGQVVDRRIVGNAEVVGCPQIHPYGVANLPRDGFIRCSFIRGEIRGITVSQTVRQGSAIVGRAVIQGPVADEARGVIRGAGTR
jgi:hypothetical protein